MTTWNINPNIERGKPDNIALFAELSSLVYQPASVIRQRLNKHGIGYQHNFEFFDGPKGTTQGFGLQVDDNIILCFRGTEPAKIKDWLADLDFWQSQIDLADIQYEVHGGFYQALENIWPHLSGWLHSRDLSDKKIWLSGHSLGGALASLALVKLEQCKLADHVAGIYTFGCPRNVDKELADHLDKRFSEITFRAVNDEDIVPHVPPDADYLEAMDFKHYGTRVFFDQNDQIFIGSNIVKWTSSKKRKSSFVSAIVNKVVDSINVVEKVSDHSMSNYLRLSYLYQYKGKGN